MFQKHTFDFGACDKGKFAIKFQWMRFIQMWNICVCSCRWNERKKKFSKCTKRLLENSFHFTNRRQSMHSIDDNVAILRSLKNHLNSMLWIAWIPFKDKISKAKHQTLALEMWFFHLIWVTLTMIGHWTETRFVDSNLISIHIFSRIVRWVDSWFSILIIQQKNLD